MELKEGQRVRLPDGVVGNIVGFDEESKRPIVKFGTHELNADKGTTVAILVETTFDLDELELEWVEGPDVHGRYWDQDGNQIKSTP